MGTIINMLKEIPYVEHKNIIRLEDNVEIGFHRTDLILSNFLVDQLIKKHNNPEYPTLREDPILRKYFNYLNCEKHLFGTKDFDQFYNWFPKENIKSLIDMGFNVVKIHAEKAILSDYQVMFHKKSVIKRENLNHLY